MAANRATEIIIPMSTSDPPSVITYSGMKTESKPNDVSWKKNPSRHIDRKMVSKMN